MCRLVMLLCCLVFAGPLLAAEKPNVIFIMADDLGYGDIGSFGQKKIRTPNLDQLAAAGMKLTRCYSGSAVCAPCRGVLMTGKHPGHAVVRDNREIKPEGQFPLPANTVTIPKLFKSLGYATGAFGKWGLGGPGSSGDPLKQGVDRFFGYNCQRVAHNFYPAYLWDNDKRIPLNNPDFSAHQKLPEGADPKNPASYAQYAARDYAPDLIMEQARKFIRDHKDQPFFCYVPTTVPHLALQVPEDSLADYLGKFPEEPYPGGRGYLPHFAPRAAYAAMITRLDKEIGRIMDLVHELNLDERTIFVFTSDNGPLYDQLGGTDCDFFESAGKLRGRKGSLYEGGFRVPVIVSWKGKIAAGAISDRVCGFEDWMPTLLELAGHAAAKPADIDGISFAPTLLGKNQEPRPFLYREFPGYGGQQLVRIGDWVGVRQKLNPAGKTKNKKMAAPAAAPVIKTELYDLKSDPWQEHDVAAQQPEILARIQKLMRDQHTPSPDFPMPALDGR